MLARYLMIFAVMITLGACSTTDDESVPAEVPVREGVSDGPLGDIYGDNMQGPSPATQAYLTQNVGDTVHFGYDRYDVDGQSRVTLEKQANWLAQHPSLTITVEGHADERGTREYNLALGDRRANAVKNYLVALGVDPSRITTISYGKERPVALGSNESAWAQNRRGYTKVD